MRNRWLKLDADRMIMHFKGLRSAPGQRRELVEFLDQAIRAEESLVSWNNGFEMNSNKNLAAQFSEPEF